MPRSALCPLLGRAAPSRCAESPQSPPVPGGPYSVGVVTGYWHVSGKHSVRDYRGWFRHSLRLNAPYVIYCDEDAIEALFAAKREGLPTTFVRRSVADFTAWKRYNASWTHRQHVPSPQLGAIWLEKVALLQATAADRRFAQLDWFAWVDAGQAFYRDRDPPVDVWPLAANLAALPRDKLIYTGTWADYHDFAGTAFMCHRSFVEELHALFYDQLDVCAATVGDWRCGNDQYMFTALRRHMPDAFFRIGDGYGNVVPLLFAPVNISSVPGTVLPPAPPPPGLAEAAAAAAAAEARARRALRVAAYRSAAAAFLAALPLLVAVFMALVWRRRAAARRAPGAT
jgi:hypothetical protein